ncbi:fatty-acyl-CoA synthase [Desulfacinum hydrothermale DSM 13146]|uniref:Fatty-acyl-CoA synthase n=1 Tax=Desulfacinum hydrothermale DSM 13146 TaxID=1121390 RepID=A0A1W1X5E3_9BACT|nr:fatty acid--CoA ligase [Desulfacinum hydrothermale]SMC19132.1 fatty-acyl-CoA synthase [Desulfacinum hydrothermale DSM 13146]
MAVKLIDKTPSAYDYPLLIKQLLHRPIRYAPEQEIVYRDLCRYTYRDLYKRIGQAANALKALGVEPGSTVGVMDWDSHRYLELFYAVPMMGAILHTVNIRLSPEQILYTVNHAEDDVLLVHEDFLPIVEAIKDQFQTVKKIVLLKDSETAPQTAVPLDGEYEELLAGADADYDFPDFDENTKATTFYTTGTTGLPKGVFFSHRQLVMHTITVMAAAGSLHTTATFRSNDVYMPLTPMFHVHAWGLPYVATQLGVKQIYPGRYEPAMIMKLLVTEKVTFSHCVPTILHMILTSPAAKEVDLSNWKVIIGGSALTKGLCKAAMDRGIDLITGYGMSETCPVLTLSQLQPHMLDWSKEDQIPVRCRTGQPIPLVNLQIMSPDGTFLPHDGKSTGEVVVRSPWLTQGYFKDPERAEELWQGGWLHTGDVGYIDETGYLQITDRIKDVIKTGGEWISTLELEDILMQHEAVSEAAAIAVPDEKWGERPMVLVVLKDDYKGKVSEEDIKAHFMGFVEEGAITKWAVPDRVAFLDALPKTSVGKLDKKVMRQQFS